MDAIALLKADHKEVKGLFREFERAKEPARKQEIAEKVFRELEMHSQIEEQIFYPAYREKANEEGQELVAEGFEEHHVVKMLINELQGLDPSQEQYEAKFTVLMENVEHHIEEEEGEMFPQAQQKLEGELDELGQRMQSQKSVTR